MQILKIKKKITKLCVLHLVIIRLQINKYTLHLDSNHRQMHWHKQIWMLKLRTSERNSKVRATLDTSKLKELTTEYLIAKSIRANRSLRKVLNASSNLPLRRLSIVRKKERVIWKWGRLNATNLTIFKTLISSPREE